MRNTNWTVKHERNLKIGENLLFLSNAEVHFTDVFCSEQQRSCLLFWMLFTWTEFGLFNSHPVKTVSLKLFMSYEKQPCFQFPAGDFFFLHNLVGFIRLKKYNN